MLRKRQRVACRIVDGKLPPRVRPRQVMRIPVEDCRRQQRIAGVIRDGGTDVREDVAPENGGNDRIEEGARHRRRPCSRPHWSRYGSVPPACPWNISIGGSIRRRTGTPPMISRRSKRPGGTAITSSTCFVRTSAGA